MLNASKNSQRKDGAKKTIEQFKSVYALANKEHSLAIDKQGYVVV